MNTAFVTRAKVLHYSNY